MAEQLSTAAQNAAADAVVDLVDADASPGTVEVRTGAQPADANQAATGTLLVTFTLGDPAFGAAAAGVAALSGTPQATAVATGTAGWFRVLDGAGATVYDGVCSDDGSGELDFDNLSIATDQVVNLNSLNYTAPAA